MAESRAKEVSLTAEIDKVKVELQKASDKASNSSDKKTIEQLSMMFEKKSLEIIEQQEKLGSMQGELNRQKNLVA